jgi:hypothetical protein
MRIVRYDNQVLQRTLKDIPGYMDCKRDLCSSGQIHVPGGLFHPLRQKHICSTTSLLFSLRFATKDDVYQMRLRQLLHLQDTLA